MLRTSSTLSFTLNAFLVSDDKTYDASIEWSWTWFDLCSVKMHKLLFELVNSWQVPGLFCLTCWLAAGFRFASFQVLTVVCSFGCDWHSISPLWFLRRMYVIRTKTKSKKLYVPLPSVQPYHVAGFGPPVALLYYCRLYDFVWTKDTSRGGECFALTRQMLSV